MFACGGEHGKGLHCLRANHIMIDEAIMLYVLNASIGILPNFPMSSSPSIHCYTLIFLLLLFPPPLSLPFLLQDGVSRREDAHQLVHLSALQVPQGKIVQAHETLEAILMPLLFHNRKTCLTNTQTHAYSCSIR